MRTTPTPTTATYDSSTRQWQDWGAWTVLALIVFVIIHLTWIVLKWGDEAQRNIIGDVAFLPPSAVAALLAVRAGVDPRLKLLDRRGWLIIAIGFISYFTGNMLFLFYDLVTDSPPFPSLADAFFLLAYPLWLWGVLTFPTHAVTDRDSATFWFDVSIVVLGLGSALWFLVLQPTLAVGYSDVLTAAISIAYPLADVVLLFGIVVIVFRQAIGANQQSLYWLAVNFVFLAIADIAYASDSLQGTYQAGNWEDVVWSMAALAAAIAAHIQWLQPHPLATTKQRVDWAYWIRIVLPYVAVAVGFFLLIYSAREHFGDGLGQLVLVAACLTALMTASQARSGQALRKARSEAEMARAGLAQANAELDARIQARTEQLSAALTQQQEQAGQLQENLSIQQQLNETIVQLSVPIIPVRDDTLVVPLGGIIDAGRAQDVFRNLLHQVEAMHIRMVFLDVTGIIAMDTHVARIILQVAAALRLLGAETILVGIRPEIAQTLVMLGADLSSLRTAATLQTGLEALVW